MKLSIVTDELSQDPQTAVQEGLNMGIRDFELRTVMGSRLPDHASRTVPLLQQLRADHGIQYSALSPGLFKCSPDPTQLTDHLTNRLEASIAVARVLGIKILICFACVDFDNHRPEQLREAVIPYLHQAAQRVSEEGMVLAVETEFMSGCETGRDAAELVSAVGSDSFRINWDVANAWIAGELPLEGYRFVRGKLANIHVKDANTADWRKGNPFVALGQGHIDWKPLLELIVQDRALPLLTIETHVEPLIENSRIFAEQLNAWLDELSIREE